MHSKRVIDEAVRRATMIGLPDEVISAIKCSQCIWQADTGELINLDTNSDPMWNDVRKERDQLEADGDFVFYAFAGLIQHVLPSNNYLTVSDDENEWGDDGVTETHFDNFPNVSIIFLAVTSPMTYGSFDFGSCYVNCENGKLSRVSLADIIESKKSSVF